MGEGKSPGTAELRALRKQHSLKTAPQILERVHKAVAMWSSFAEQAGVSRKTADGVAAEIGLK